MSTRTTSIHTVASLRADHGGPGRSITSLCSALADSSIDVHLIARAQQPGEPAAVLPWSPLVQTHFCNAANPLTATITRKNPHARSLESVLAGISFENVVVHDHGIWLPTNHAVAVLTRRRGIPRVVSPRGMLSKWSLGHQKWRKIVAWRLYQRADLSRATAFHVTSAEEAEDVRKLGFRQPIALLSNGVDLPPSSAPALKRTAKREALFLSRIHPVKGLFNLVAAWSKIRPPNWTLIIAGPDDGDHRRQVQHSIEAEGISDLVKIIGPVTDEAKWQLYQSADLFVLPSFSENFAIVVAEALASGVPVITTKATPWRNLLEHRCGWWIDVGIEPLVDALAKATDLDDGARREMGARGRAFVSGELSWDGIAARMAELYSWLLHGGAQPSALLQE